MEIEYEKIRPGYPNTVEGQWALAQWCLERHLTTQREMHLERILELDANHEEARRALGHSQVDGQWKTQKEVMLSRGFRWYKGRWRLPQDIELMERKNKVETAEREWFGKVRMWRGWLATNKESQARKNLLGITDPYAVKALAAGLENEKVQQVRTLYIEILSKIGSPEAIKTLASFSMEDPSLEIRLTCIDHLKQEKRPEVVSYYVSKLKSKDNKIVRRAAVGLSHTKDLSAVGPLIDALITIHKYKIVKGSGNPNQQSYSFGSGPGGVPGFNFGGGGTKIIKQP
ncbi:MAG: HEAT repeat domain-containing protein, partial [Planctomycetota bacterium]